LAQSVAHPEPARQLVDAEELLDGAREDEHVDATMFGERQWPRARAQRLVGVSEQLGGLGQAELVFVAVPDEVEAVVGPRFDRYERELTEGFACPSLGLFLLVVARQCG
jgi:hypothetical protein